MVKAKEKTEAVEGEVVPAKTNSKTIVKRDTKAKPKKAKKSELVERGSAYSIVGNVTTEQLKTALGVQTEQRKLIEDFIKQHLREGADYGKIHVVKNCMAEDKQRGSCDKSYHFSKSILFKPGQEKIFSLFSITDKLEKDLEAYEMLSGVSGLVAFKCTMYQNGVVIGEGRGAATLAGERSDPNSTLKKAEKRARMDACLSLGFSEYFTQDLDDPDYAAQREMANSRAAAEAERIDKDEFGLMPRDPALPIDQEERTTLFTMILKYGIHKYYVLESLRLNGIADPGAITSGSARMLMTAIKNNAYEKPEQVEIPQEPELVKDSQLPEDNYPPERPAVQEPELVVDEDLKLEVERRVDEIGLNPRGRVWLFKRAIGKPFAKFESLTDSQWRVLYDVVEGILDGHETVELEYLSLPGEPELVPDTDATVESKKATEETEIPA